MLRTRFFLVLLVVSCIALGGSFALEFAFSEKPCSLCLLQRGVYLGLAPLAVCGLAARFQRLVRVCCLVLLCAGALIAFYHTLVQIGIVKDRCKKEMAVHSVESFLDMLQKPQKGCAERGGLAPLSMLNGIVLVGLVVFRARSKR